MKSVTVETERAARYRLRRRQRVRHRREFDRIYREGAHAADDTLVVHARPNSLPWSRLGISVPRRVGNAVVRNRWKRWIREAFRLHQHELPAGFDFAVRPRKGAQGDWLSVERSLVRVARAAVKRSVKKRDR